QAGQLRHSGLEQLELLRAEIGGGIGEASKVSSRPRQARGQAFDYRIGGDGNDDGNAGGGEAQRTVCGASCCHDDVNIRPQQLRRETGQAVDFTVPKARLDDDILAGDITEFAHTLHESIVTASIQRRLARTEVEKSDAPDLVLLLRERCERHGEQAGRSTCNESPPVNHRVTSSARGSDCVIPVPSRLPAFKREFSVLAGSTLGNLSVIPLSSQRAVYAECPSSNRDVVSSRAGACAEPSAPSAMQSAPTLTPRSRILRSSGTRFRHSPAARRITRASCVGARMVWSRVTV